MTDTLVPAAGLGGTSVRAGYRLHRLEVLNWGTFDKRAWRLSLDGATTLLTGDPGSGTADLVDALTTLLLPAPRMTGSQPAGPEPGERTLRSYVEGHYACERVESAGTWRPVGLRDHRHFSVVLGVFVNDAYNETVTLAQVFSRHDRDGEPGRFFVTSAKQLAIDTDFTDFGADPGDLRRRLRAAGAEIHVSFPDYGARVRRLLGVTSEQALDLVGRAAALHTAGDLTGFLRAHVLDPADATAKIAGITGRFEELTAARDAALQAREQIEALQPLTAASRHYEQASARHGELERQRDSAALFIAELRIALLDEQIAAHEERRASRARTAAEAREKLANLTSEREALIAERAAAGGDRLSQLERQAVLARSQEAERRQRRTDFTRLLDAAGLAAVSSAAEFASLATSAGAARAQLETRLRALEDQLDAEATGRGEVTRDTEQTRAELASLARRRSNLPAAQLELRARLCQDLGITESELPFAAELLEVRAEHADWRGAAERVLRDFGLSLLVRQEHYDRVSAWASEHRLTGRGPGGAAAGTRLVLEVVPAARAALRPAAGHGALLLADTIEVADGPLHDYLRDELTRRAEHTCAATIEEFRAGHRAVTREGQIRAGDRYEQDDRSRADDPRSWVLGWSNEAKREALTAHLVRLRNQLHEADARRDALRGQRDAAARRRAALDSLAVFRSWTELDHAEAAARADTAQEERLRLIGGSAALAEIDQRLRSSAAQTAAVRGMLDTLGGDVRVAEEAVRQASEAREADQKFVAGLTEAYRAVARSYSGQLTRRLGTALPTATGQCAEAAATLAADFQSSIDRIGRELAGYSHSLLQEMAEVRRRWPADTAGMAVSVEARADYVAFGDRVAGDHLPRLEKELSRQLTATTSELAEFSSWLSRQEAGIRQRVEAINTSLAAIGGSPDRVIRLDAEPTSNLEVQNFRADLLAATGDAENGGDDDGDQRFDAVQEIIEQLRGCGEDARASRAWVRRVTDVRNWFTFSAAEVARDGDGPADTGRDAGGQSREQQEKLAYTILAAALAGQLGVERGAQKSKALQFAVLGGAFGHGCDPATRYALELFARLGMQLLIIAPPRKVPVLEPHVQAIGFADNPTGSCSRLLNLTIEDFRNAGH